MEKYIYIGGLIPSFDLTLNKIYYVMKEEKNELIGYKNLYIILDDFWIDQIKYDKIVFEECLPKGICCLISEEQLNKCFIKV